MIVIESKGGLIETVGVLFPDGTFVTTDDYVVFDWDTLTDDRCPICNTSLEKVGEQIVEMLRTVKLKMVTEVETIEGHKITITQPARNDYGDLVVEKFIDHKKTSGGHWHCPGCGWDEKEDDSIEKFAKYYLKED